MVPQAMFPAMLAQAQANSPTKHLNVSIPSSPYGPPMPGMIALPPHLALAQRMLLAGPPPPLPVSQPFMVGGLPYIPSSRVVPVPMMGKPGILHQPQFVGVPVNKPVASSEVQTGTMVSSSKDQPGPQWNGLLAISQPAAAAEDSSKKESQPTELQDSAIVAITSKSPPQSPTFLLGHPTAAATTQNQHPALNWGLNPDDKKPGSNSASQTASPLAREPTPENQSVAQTRRSPMDVKWGTPPGIPNLRCSLPPARVTSSPAWLPSPSQSPKPRANPADASVKAPWKKAQLQKDAPLPAVDPLAFTERSLDEISSSFKSSPGFLTESSVSSLENSPTTRTVPLYLRGQTLPAEPPQGSPSSGIRPSYAPAVQKPTTNSRPASPDRPCTPPEICENDMGGILQFDSGSDDSLDPMDVLRNLNIKASPETKRLYEYFS